MQVAFFLAFLGVGLAERHVSLHRLDQAAGFVGALKEPPAEGESEAKGRKSAFLQVTALALCGGAWCGIAMNASKDKDSPTTAGDFVKFRNGMQALGEVHCHSDPVTLSFMNPELEKLYTSSNAEVICKRLRPICGALLLYVLIVCAFSEQHDGSIVLNPALFKLSSTASIVYCFAAAIMVFLTVALLVFSFFPSFQRSKVLEPCVIAWIFVIILCGWVFFYRWTLAAFNGRDPEREFVSNGFDGEYIASLEIFAVYFCIHTPLRFKLLAPLVAPLPFLYLATVLCFGSPEGMQHHQLHVIQGEKVGQFDFLADELELSLLMALLLYLVLWGKYVHERSSRTSFLSMWESFQMVQELSGQDSSQAATGVGKASEALRQALAKLDALASMQTSVEISECVVLAKSKVELSRRILQRADQLFEVNAEDALKGTGHDDNAELKDFISANMGNLSSFIGSEDSNARISMGDEDLSKLSAGIKDSVKVQEAAELAPGWGADWSFSALELGYATKDHACIFAGELALVQSGHCDILASIASRREWVRAIHTRYLPNSYHNEAHAAQVSHFCYWFAKQTGWLDKASRVQSCALLVAALAHDVGHIGRTNLFCIKAQHSFSLIWNEAAPLENMHAATCFATMQGDANVLAGMDAATRSKLRKAVIRFILATDIKEHHASLAKLNGRMEDGQFLQETSESKEAAEKLEEDLLMAGEAIIKTSDIAHGMLPWEQHRTWSYRVNLEFFEQGDEEKALGLAISPLCDRATCNIAGGQAFFIGCLCKDLFIVLQKFASARSGAEALDECLALGESNKERWKDEAALFDAHNLSTQVIEERFGNTIAEEPIFPYPFEKESAGQARIQTAENLAAIARFQYFQS